MLCIVFCSKQEMIRTDPIFFNCIHIVYTLFIVHGASTELITNRVIKRRKNQILLSLDQVKLLSHTYGEVVLFESINAHFFSSMKNIFLAIVFFHVERLVLLAIVTDFLLTYLFDVVEQEKVR